MRLLLDTHIFYWSFYNPDQLSKKTLAAITAAEAVYVSSASIWEMAIKVRLGKMDGDPSELAENIGAAGFRSCLCGQDTHSSSRSCPCITPIRLIACSSLKP